MPQYLFLSPIYGWYCVDTESTIVWFASLWIVHDRFILISNTSHWHIDDNELAKNHPVQWNKSSHLIIFICSCSRILSCNFHHFITHHNNISHSTFHHSSSPIIHLSSFIIRHSSFVIHYSSTVRNLFQYTNKSWSYTYHPSQEIYLITNRRATGVSRTPFLKHHTHTINLTMNLNHSSCSDLNHSSSINLVKIFIIHLQ